LGETRKKRKKLAESEKKILNARPVFAGKKAGGGQWERLKEEGASKR